MNVLSSVSINSIEPGRPIIMLGDELDCLHKMQSDPRTRIAPDAASVFSQAQAAILSMDLSAGLLSV